MMNIIGWIIFGLIVGIIARFLKPGPQPMGTIMTILLGIAGSFLGGTIVNLFQGGGMLEGRTVGWIGSILGAILLLVIYGMMSKKTAA
jgi:uncharacterized membrane protein YeaQ/YmgE (transglycosylase-associated protein family)